MRKPEQGSIRRKLFLAIFVPSFILSVVLGGISLWIDLEALRVGLQREASVLAEVLAGAIKAPITIGDKQTLQSTLEAAGAQENVLSVVARDVEGNVIGKFQRTKEPTGNQRQTYAVKREIAVGKEVIGELSILVSLDVYFSRRTWYIFGGICSLLVITGVAGAVAAMLQNRLLAPLETLTGTARAISSGRNYSVRAQHFQDAEFKPLTTAFNQMLDEIEKQTEALNSANAGLRRANSELEAFTYSVSHDLRTPLRAISSFAQILNSSGEPLTEESREALRIIQKNAAKMAQLIDDLLAFSRIDAHPLERKTVDLTEVAQDAWAEIEPQTKGRAVDIRIERLGTAQVDEGLFHQVFLNLLSNAAKYSRTRDRSEILVGREFRDEQQVYFVRDNGVGFDMKHAAKLFGVFERLHGDHEFEGTGVGLALVQRIIDRHGGKIWAYAEANKGATFFFTIGHE